MNWKCLQSRFCLWETNLVPSIGSQKIWPSCVFRSPSPWLSEPWFPQAKTGTLSQPLSLRLFYTSISSFQRGFRSPSREDPLKKEMATHSSILAWEIPWAEEPGGLRSLRSRRAGHDWTHAESKRTKAPVLFRQRVPNCSFCRCSLRLFTKGVGGRCFKWEQWTFWRHSGVWRLQEDNQLFSAYPCDRDVESREGSILPSAGHFLYSSIKIFTFYSFIIFTVL